MPTPPDRKSPVTPARIVIWVVVGGAGVALIVAGLISVLNGGG